MDNRRDKNTMYGKDIAERLVDPNLNTFDKFLDFDIIKAEENHSELSMLVTQQLLNVGDVMHGGAALTLADCTMGMAVKYLDEPYITMDVNYHFLRSAVLGERIRAVGDVVKLGKTTIVTEATLYNEKDQPIGKATGSFYRLNAKRHLD